MSNKRIAAEEYLSRVGRSGGSSIKTLEAFEAGVSWLLDELASPRTAALLRFDLFLDGAERLYTPQEAKPIYVKGFEDGVDYVKNKA